MIRTITCPSTARCTLPMYISFLLGEPQYGSCSRLAGVMDISHDSANRSLQPERYEGKDLYHESAPLLALKGGALSVGDSGYSGEDNLKRVKNHAPGLLSAIKSTHRA